jgi:hypothetical protein
MVLPLPRTGVPRSPARDGGSPTSHGSIRVALAQGATSRSPKRESIER